MTGRKKTPLARLATGIPHLDATFQGGLPVGSVSIIAGPPGGGKTILAHQVLFANASERTPAVCFNTLSEPTAKTLRYLQQFNYFDPVKLDTCVHFVDLGVILRTKGLEKASGLIMDELRRTKPAVVVIDSFKVFDDLAKSPEELRKFGYEVAVNLMAWECTALLLGEYGPRDVQTNPILSVVDGLIQIEQREVAGEQQRFLRVVKMRGTDQSRDEHAFAITESGVELYSPRVTIRRDRDTPAPGALARAHSGIERLDELLGDGIPRGSSVLVAGSAGLGKTLLTLEVIYRGAKTYGERGIFFSFEEPESRLREGARLLGWDLDAVIASGLVEIVFVPQPEIMVERHLLMMQERIERSGARRVAVDSITTFLFKVKDPQVAREKVFQLASIVSNRGAIGLFAASIPHGASHLSRFGVEETVLDGVIVLEAREEGGDRVKTIEVLKLRNTAHRKGRHVFGIGAGGVSIEPCHAPLRLAGPASIDVSKRVRTGVPGLDELLGGGLFERSLTLVTGPSGSGLSALGKQLVLAGAGAREPGVIASFEESAEQVVATAEAMGLPLAAAVGAGLVEVVSVLRRDLRCGRFLAVVDDALRRTGARLAVFDGIVAISRAGLEFDASCALAAELALLLKRRGVTALVEDRPGFEVQALGLEALSDSALVLGLTAGADGEPARTIRVAKMRGGGHDGAEHPLHVGVGGLRVEARTTEAPGADRGTEP